MKKFITTILLVAILLLGPALAKEPDNLIDGFAKAFTVFYGELIKQRLALYFACTTYYSRFKRWPSNKEDLLTVKDVFAKEGKDKDILPNLLKDMDISFTPLDNGSVLIKGRYHEATERNLEKSRVGKCRISMVASLEKDKIIFKPSDEAKGNKDFFSLPARVDLKNNATEPEPSSKK